MIPHEENPRQAKASSKWTLTTCSFADAFIGVIQSGEPIRFGRFDRTKPRDTPCYVDRNVGLRGGTEVERWRKCSRKAAVRSNF